nr:MAG: ORF1 [Torque teno polar bear virus 16]
MPYRRRYRARRRFTRRRHLFRYRRRRRWLPRRRRRFGRRRSVPVRQYRPRKTTHLTVRGWEFLGQLGTEITYNWVPEDNEKPGGEGKWSIDLTDVAPTNKEVVYLQTLIPDAPADYTRCSDRFAFRNTSHWDFVGGFGAARFTFRTLLIRALLGFARFSTSLKGWSFIKFKGFSFKLNRGKTIDYLFRASTHIGREDVETSLIHPASFLNLPFVKWVQSVFRTKCCKSPVVRRKPDISIYGWHDIEDFQNMLLARYEWTAFDPNNPLGKNPNITKQLKAPIKNDWMQETNANYSGNRGVVPQMSTYCPKWLNRKDYDSAFVNYINFCQQDQKTKRAWWEWDLENEEQANKQNWDKDTGLGRVSPFLPTLMPAERPETLWFQYIFKFQLGGAGIGRYPPSYPIREADTCGPCPNQSGCSAACDACIDPKKDLDSWGLLTKKAYERITRGPQRTKKRLVEKLARIIQLRRRKRRRVHWADEEKEAPFITWGQRNTKPR